MNNLPNNRLIATATAVLVPMVAFVLGTRIRRRGVATVSAVAAPRHEHRASSDPRPPRWVASPARRNWIATAVGILPAIALIVMIRLESGSLADDWGVPMVMIVWATYSIVHSALTVAALWGLEGDRLHRSVVPPKRSGIGSRMTSSARSLAVQTPLVVLIIVVVIVVTPAFRGDRNLVVLVLAFVVVAWINTALLFTEGYIARGQDGLRFPGDGPIGFGDYLYFALSVQMTFGTSDTAITDRTTRRNVTIHAVTAFAFNTVIIAMIVALLVSG
ncbi:MAG: DUF1345 domain-containing protein [Microbacterium gubbeenense]|uniref:DUF1345 domain-containing protein n=1 Tax=Microbacterium gubbeenense TaxID=159896 RepID=UPI003F9C8E36